MEAKKSLVLSIIGKDETKQAFDSVGKNIKNADDTSKNFGKTLASVGSSLKSFGTSMSAFATAPLVALGGFAVESGAQLSTLQDSYGRMTKIMGINSEELMRVMQETSRGSISQSDMLLAANKAMSLGVVKNTDEMATIMEIARVKGQTMGLSMTQAFGDLVTGLGRSSAMILDNLGIIIKVGEVNEAYAKSIGKVASELTAEEMKMALVNAVVSQGKTELQAMGEVSVTNQEKIAQMTARLTDMKAELGQQLLPYAVKLTETLVEWIKKYQALDPSVKNVIIAIAALVAIIGPLSLALSALITIATTLATVVGFLVSPFGLVVLAIIALIAIGVALYKNWDLIKWSAGELWKYLTSVFDKGSQWLKGVIDSMINWFDGLIEKIKSAIEWLKKYSGYNAVSGAVSSATNSLGSVFGGAKALGGPVAQGKTYLVGERGPELFTAGSSGSITPNNKLGGSSFVINVTGNTLLDQRSAEKIGDMIINKLKLSNAL